MDAASKALLLCEIAGDRGCCPICRGAGERLHEIDCVLDTALAERGFHSAGDRAGARERLSFTSNTTLPAPPSSKDLDELEPARTTLKP